MAGVRERAALNRLKAMELRRAGATYEEIGKVIGVSPSRACRYVHAVLAQLAASAMDEAEELRRIEEDRLDRLFRALWPLALDGDVKASLAILKLMERRARLRGLDAPTRSDVTSEGAPVRFLVSVDGSSLISQPAAPTGEGARGDA